LGANPDRGNQSVASGVASVFAFATPKAVLVVIAGEAATHRLHGAPRADGFGGGLAAVSSLWSLRRRREEQMRQPFAGGTLHPPIIGSNAMEQ